MLIGVGNSDQLFGGAGNDQLAGDSSGSTDAADYVGLAYHGDDYLDGGGKKQAPEKPTRAEGHGQLACTIDTASRSNEPAVPV